MQYERGLIVGFVFLMAGFLIAGCSANPPPTPQAAPSLTIIIPTFAPAPLPAPTQAVSATLTPASGPSVTLPLGQTQAIITNTQTYFANATYVGSQVCKACHAKQYADWQNTWHAKMSRAVSPGVIVADFNNVTLTFKNIVADTPDGKAGDPITVTVRLSTRDDRYFFTLVDNDNDANNQTYEVNEVIGGNWDQHFETTVEGQNFPTPMRWAVGDKSWLVDGFQPNDWFIADGTADGIPRKPTQLKNLRSSDAKCRNCHETGYQVTLDAQTKKYIGKSTELGIACEYCHGPGSLHVQGGGDKTKIVNPLKLTALQQDQLCAECHGRQSNRQNPDLAFQTGFRPGDIDLMARTSFWSANDPDPAKAKFFWPSDWASKNRQQWQDLNKSQHYWKTDVSCLTCHTAHGEAQGNLLRVARDQLCITCHTAQGLAAKPNAELFSTSVMAKAGVTCVDCHMPKIGTRTNPSLANPKAHWDTSAHTFMVSKPEYSLEFGQRSSCDACHLPGGSSSLTMDHTQQDALLRSRQNEIRGLLNQATASQEQARQLLSAAPNAALQSKWDAATTRVDIILRDGSLGFHNYPQAKTWLDEANALYAEILSAFSKSTPTPIK